MIQQLERAAAAKRAAARSTYNRLIRRTELSDAEAAELLECCHSLGKTPADVEADVAVLSRLAEIDGLERKLADTRGKIPPVEAEVQRARAELEAAQRKLASASPVRTELERACNLLELRLSELRQDRMRFAELFN
jgi:hypothetical protein